MVNKVASLFLGCLLAGLIPVSTYSQDVASALADDPNKQLVESTCITCHRLSMITRSFWIYRRRMEGADQYHD